MLNETGLSVEEQSMLVDLAALVVRFAELPRRDDQEIHAFNQAILNAKNAIMANQFKKGGWSGYDQLERDNDEIQRSR